MERVATSFLFGMIWGARGQRTLAQKGQLHYPTDESSVLTLLTSFDRNVSWEG